MDNKRHPRKLYKFQCFSENALLLLTTRSIWFSKQKYLNDPFEVINLVSDISDSSYEQAWRKRLSNLNFSLNEIEKEINRLMLEKNDRIRNGLSLISEGMKSVGLCCLTDYPDSILMWSHYANSHKGFCIEYEVTPKNILRLNNKLFKVSYTKRYPKMSALDFMPCGSCNICEMSNSITLTTPFQCKAIGTSFAKLIASKSIDWKYENEFRIVYETENEKNNAVGFIRPLDEVGLQVKAIIFGPRMPQDQQLTIRKLVGNTVQFREARMSKFEFKMVGCK